MKTTVQAILLSVAAILLLVLGHLSPLRFSNFELLSEHGVEPVTFPFNVSSTGEHVYVLRGHLHLDYFVPSELQVIPDDRLLAMRINERMVPLEHIPANQLSDYRQGFITSFAEFLHKGDNLIEFQYSDRGGRMGINMIMPVGNFLSTSLYLGWALWFTLLLYLLRHRLGLGKSVVIILGFSFALRFLYLMVTNFDTRPHDIWAHLSYIEYFTRTFAPPPLSSATDGAFFHPPLYYFLASFVHRFASWMYAGDMPQVLFVLQIFSLLFSMLFTVVAAKTVQLAFSVLALPKTALTHVLPITTTLLVVFWPSGILHSVRIGNDPLLYFLLALGSYGLLTWYHTPSFRKFLLVVIVTALAIITKANGAVLAVAGLLVLLGGFAKHAPMVRATQVKRGIPWLLAILVAMGIAFYPGLALKMSGERTHLYVSNIDRVSQANQVGNHAGNYFWFDVQTFLTKPWTDPFDDTMGRQYFWNYMAKTGLFGEWQYTPAFAQEIAIVISFLFLLLFGYALWAIGTAKAKDFWDHSPITWVALLLLAGVTYMRITFPVNIDFRYILPVIIPFAIVTGYGFSRLQELGHARLAWFGVAVQTVFALGSALFILSVVLH